MSSEWENVELGDFASVRSGYAFKSVDWTDVGIPVVKIANVKSGRLEMQSCSHVDEETAAKAGDFQLSAGDILIAMTGYIGEVARVRDTDLPCVLNQRVGKFDVRDDERLDSSYLFALLTSQEIRKTIESLGYGSAQPNVSPSLIQEVEIPLPPLPEQRRIAKILGDLDDKIELNRKMNETLEQMARALFKSWFVDFDPVRAKMEGRTPTGMDAATAALFPDRLVDSELGPIPEGWEVGRLDDALVLQRGFDLPTSERIHGKYPVLAASGPNGCHEQFMVKGPGVTTGRSGILGRVFFVHGDFWPLNTSLWVKEFKCVTPAYAFHLLRSLDFDLFDAGSAVPTLNRNHVHNRPVVLPTRSVVTAFDDQVMPMMKDQHSNDSQSRTLSTLRDTLLPKLVSGEIRV